MCIRCYVHPGVCILRWYVHQETEATPWSCIAWAFSDTIECTQTERSHNYANFQHCPRRRKKDPYIPECDVMPASVFAQSHFNEYAYAEVSARIIFRPAHFSLCIRVRTPSIPQFIFSYLSLSASFFGLCLYIFVSLTLALLIKMQIWHKRKLVVYTIAWMHAYQIPWLHDEHARVDAA